MFRCKNESCEFYTPPLHTYFPGVMWIPLFEAIESCATSLETYGSFAQAYLRENAALYDEFKKRIICQDNSHVKLWEFEEAGIKFFTECSSKECTRIVRGRIAAREDVQQLIAAIQHCKNNFSAMVRVHQERLHPLYIRMRETTDSIRDFYSIGVSYSYKQFYPFSLEKNRSERVEAAHGTSSDLLRIFMDPLCKNIAVNFTHCPHHGPPTSEQMDAVD